MNNEWMEEGRTNKQTEENMNELRNERKNDEQTK